MKPRRGRVLAATWAVTAPVATGDWVWSGRKSAVPGSVYKRRMRWWWYGAGLTGQYLRRKLTPKGREACAYDDNIGRANS